MSEFPYALEEQTGEVLAKLAAAPAFTHEHVFATGRLLARWEAELRALLVAHPNLPRELQAVADDLLAKAAAATGINLPAILALVPQIIQIVQQIIAFINALKQTA